VEIVARRRTIVAMTRVIPIRVLVIDDDETVCRRIAGWLTEAHYDVLTFTDPAAGLARAAQVAFQLAIVDLRLPDANGVELIAALRRAHPRLRIIGVSAFPDVGQVIAAVRAGATDVLEKPLQPAGLLTAIERQLAESGVTVRTESEYNRRLGARVRAARTAAALTLSELAQGCGLSPAQVSHIELGRTATSTWTLARICSVLKTSPGSLLDQL
jgi:two-component system C4-dicarboxylate transport response regulator DctD